MNFNDSEIVFVYHIEIEVAFLYHMDCWVSFCIT